MKRLCSLLMALVLLAGCALGESAPEFRRMGDAALLPYLENSLYEQLVSDLDSSDYFVENVQAVYISQEYLDALAFNSQENVYFGYTLSELNVSFRAKSTSSPLVETTRRSPCRGRTTMMPTTA